jgi:hypothetical protein
MSDMTTGDTIALCRGGSWSPPGDYPITMNKRCTRDATCDIRDYGRGARPVLNFNSRGQAWILDGASWIRIWNLDLRQAQPTIPETVAARNDTRNIDICGNAFSGGRLPLHFAPTGRDNLNIRVRNNTVSDAHFAGFLGGGPDLQIVNNTFTHNGYSGAASAHTVYMTTHSPGVDVPQDGAPGTNPIVFSNNQVTTDDRCGGVMVVIHGQFLNTGIVMENNNISTTSTNGNCEGIQISGGQSGAAFHGFHMRRNRIAPGSHSQSIEMNCCVDCSIESNAVTNAIAVGWATQCTNGASAWRDIIQNNTVYVPSTPWEAAPIFVTGSGHTVTNNAVWANWPSCYSLSGATTNANNYCRTNGGVAANVVFVNAAGGDFTPANPGPLIGAGHRQHYSLRAIGSAPWTASDPGVARTAPNISIGAVQ